MQPAQGNVLLLKADLHGPQKGNSSHIRLFLVCLSLQQLRSTESQQGSAFWLARACGRHPLRRGTHHQSAWESHVPNRHEDVQVRGKRAR